MTTYEKFSNKVFGRVIDPKALFRVGLFSFNNSACNTYHYLMFFVSYYATGVAGLGVAVVGFISTFSRLWDGIIDPMIGLIIDKTNGRFGKFRVCMVLGQVIMASSLLVMFHTVHRVPEGFRLIYYIVLYLIYVIGYSFQTTVTKSGLTVVASESGERTSYTFFDTIITSIHLAIMAIVSSGSLFERYGGFTEGYFSRFLLISIGVSAFLTILAMIGIWTRDRSEFFGGDEESTEKLSLKTVGQTFKGNHNFRMLVLSTATDKIAATVKSSSILMVVLFGIMLGNYSLYGTASGVVTIPAIIVSFIGTGYAIRKGLRKAMWMSTAYNVGIATAMIAVIFYVFRSGDASPVMSTVIIILYALLYCMETFNGSLIYPMLSDVTDYEMVRSGNYVPGIISSLFSFVDQVVSSLSTTIISLGLVVIGFTDVQPTPDDTMTTALFAFFFVMYYVFPLTGWLINFWALKRYDLTNEKMDEIHAEMRLRGIGSDPAGRDDDGEAVPVGVESAIMD